MISSETSQRDYCPKKQPACLDYEFVLDFDLNFLQQIYNYKPTIKKELDRNFGRGIETRIKTNNTQQHVRHLSKMSLFRSFCTVENIFLLHQHIVGTTNISIANSLIFMFCLELY